MPAAGRQPVLVDADLGRRCGFRANQGWHLPEDVEPYLRPRAIGRQRGQGVRARLGEFPLHQLRTARLCDPASI
ncbi:hypothetical protein VSS93_27900, partial [Pseudomonas syringae pv. tagetis]